MSHLDFTLSSQLAHGARRHEEKTVMNQALLELHTTSRIASHGRQAANAERAQRGTRGAAELPGAALATGLSPRPSPVRARGWAARPSDIGPQERTGFDIGWDHAHFGLVPPAELLLADSPIGQGWTAGKTVFRGRSLAPRRHTRQWLQLRLLAWRQNLPFEPQQLTPNYLAQIESPRCPVTRQALQGAPGRPDTLVLQRLNPQAGFAAGNLASISQAAAWAMNGLDVVQGVRQARRLEAAAALQARDKTGRGAGWAADHALVGAPGSAPGSAPISAPASAAASTAQRAAGEASALTAAQCWRLTVLRSFATPLPFGEAARLPLAVLPPNRVRLLNPVQGLQALLTRNFLSPGWAERCNALAQQLPAHSLRLDFKLFIGAFVPRVLEAGTADTTALRHALEDAWLQDRVQRRWQHLVFSLGSAQTETLLQQAVAAGMGSVRTLNLSPDEATEGWALPIQASGQQGLNLRPSDAQ